jgi:hypothetical protein
MKEWVEGWMDGRIDKRFISYTSYIERITQIQAIINAKYIVLLQSRIRNTLV